MTQPGQLSPYGALPVPHVTPDMLGLVRGGTVYSLAVMHHEGIPVPGPTLYTHTAFAPATADIAPAAPPEIIAWRLAATHIDAVLLANTRMNRAILTHGPGAPVRQASKTVARMRV
jgi:hypothetical protein